MLELPAVAHEIARRQSHLLFDARPRLLDVTTYVGAPNVRLHHDAPLAPLAVHGGRPLNELDLREFGERDAIAVFCRHRYAPDGDGIAAITLGDAHRDREAPLAVLQHAHFARPE